MDNGVKRYASEEYVDNKLSEKITSPTTVTVGQVLSVKAVDENNTPTEWETIAPSSFDEIYIGSGEMSDGYKIQIDPDGESDEFVDQYARDEIDKKITSPSTAEVGQTLRVKSVDENGKPTEWECANITETNITPYTKIMDCTATDINGDQYIRGYVSGLVDYNDPYLYDIYPKFSEYHVYFKGTGTCTALSNGKILFTAMLPIQPVGDANIELYTIDLASKDYTVDDITTVETYSIVRILDKSFAQTTAYIKVNGTDVYNLVNTSSSLSINNESYLDHIYLYSASSNYIFKLYAK